jgi:phosphohistidine phosphatase
VRQSIKPGCRFFISVREKPARGVRNTNNYENTKYEKVLAAGALSYLYFRTNSHFVLFVPFRISYCTLKAIWFVRHAKSSWDLDLDDSFRPLNERGYRDAAEMAKRLKKHAPNLLLISSPAIRAYSTAVIFGRFLGSEAGDIILNRLLYNSATSHYLAAIRSIPEECDEVMIFGHNPVITETVNLLAGTEMEEIPTCGIAAVRFEHDRWDEAARGHGSLFYYDFPKNKSQ